MLHPKIKPVQSINLNETNEMEKISKIAEKYLGTKKGENIKIYAVVKQPTPVKIKVKKNDALDFENFYKRRREQQMKQKT